MLALTRASLKAQPVAVGAAYLCEVGREGLFNWRTGDFSAQVAADTLEGLYLSSDYEASTSGAWVRANDWCIDPCWFGANPNGLNTGLTDDTAALQAAINFWRNPNITNLPGQPGVNYRLFSGRVLDLKGRHYGVTEPLNVSNAHGMHVTSGVLVAIGDEWAGDGEAVIEGDLPINSRWTDLVVEANDKTNCMRINRGYKMTMRNVHLYGFGQCQYGFRSTTGTGGLEMMLDDMTVFGSISGNTGTPPNVIEAIGIDIQGGSDCEMRNVRTSRCGIGVNMAAGGWQISNCHFTGQQNYDDNIGLKLSGSQATVNGCYFDDAYLHLVGLGVRVITNNKFRASTDTKMTSCIAWEADAANQVMQSLVCTDNYAYNTGTNKRFIRLVEPGSFNFKDIRWCVVGRNLCHGADLFNPTCTFGEFYVTVGGGAWSGGTTTADLNNFLLFPIPGASAPFTVTGCAATVGGTVTTLRFDHANYNLSTGILTLKFDNSFSGRAGVTFQWGEQQAAIAGAPP